MLGNKKQMTTVLITVVITLVIVGIGVGIFIALNSKSTEKAKPTQNDIYVVAEGFADSENYKEAVEVLQKADDSEKNTKKYNDLYNKYKDKYISQTLKNVKKLKKKKDYYSAIKEINDATAIIGSNDILNQELKSLSKEPKAKKKQAKKKTSSKSSNSSNNQSAQSPFWGIWLSASKSKTEAQKQADELKAKGYSAEVILTSEWSNLNSEPWYAVTTGRYKTADEADAYMPSILSEYSDAYAKYSGDYLK